MGNTKSSALSKELLEELKSNTKYTEAELCTWYQSFLKECPSGRISKQQFEGIYASFFPDADPTACASALKRPKTLTLQFRACVKRKTTRPASFPSAVYLHSGSLKRGGEMARQSNKWTDNEVELLLRVTNEYKVSKASENIDWETDQNKYAKYWTASKNSIT
ncbi:visinin-like [Neolamprologus brichardi]|uniref:visinin-like n=1 Tax=Neolamprologus brichardi TaxID=32507 RepID=UPI001643D063|nr:visinin-like [Neolamprologus brichardi]